VHGKAPEYTFPMTVLEAGERHQELIDELIATVAAYNPDVDRDLLSRAFRFAAAAHAGQQRRSGEDFINHPWGAAKICAELRLDEETIAAALLHDVVEDTGTDIKEVRDEFGDEIAQLVEGVTKLTRIQFQSREQAEAENYRKMIVAMAQDVRVILIKLADRLHNMRTIEYLGKQKQVQKGKETLEVYAPLAHRLGINKLKWELEDLAFSTLHPRKYDEIKAMVSERRADREEHVREAAMTLQRELEKVDIPADISGRAKHFYSIYDKMAKKGREFNEIYDLTAMRVIVERDGDEGTRDCYGALGLIHSLWKPMPGRFKDYVAMPKLNGYRALHTTVVGPEGRPLEIQVRTREMHETAEFGVAAHWLYKVGSKDGPADEEWLAWIRQLMDWQEDETDPREFIKTFRTDLFDDEVYVFTPKGEVKVLPSNSTPIDFAYAVHTDVGHRTVGAKINGRIVPLHYRLKSGDFVEILTTKAGRGPSRDWLSLAASSRARNKIRQWFSRETREETEQKGRESLEAALKKQNLPYKKLQGSAVLAQVIRETGFKKAEDFYLALGSGKLAAGQIVNKVIQRLKTEEVATEEAVPLKAPKARHAVSSENFGISVRGVDDVLVRLAKCCTPLPGDDIVGYISLGKGITIHRADCSNVKALRRNPERFTNVSWDGGATQSFRVQISVDSWDRPRLLEDVARTFAEHGANIVEYGGHVEDQLAKNWYVAEVGDVKALRSLLTALRNLDAVFDAYRVTPS
jgi:GTP diphosphokinase / guanosine-3',5'-bis(diphosphate) 3'-diphosphatase